MSRRSRRALTLAFFAVAVSCSAHAAEPAIETILFIRHGEKPADGLGQLNCQGLNRALALPTVIKSKYGRLDAVFAPNPSQRKPDGKNEDDETVSYDYVRPLATAEPTAVAFGLPIRTEIGYTDIAKLKSALLDPAYRNATVLVAWEHHQIAALVPDLITSLGGTADAVGKWPKKDFDSIWRLTIRRDGGTTSVAFAHDQEGLDGQPTGCPR